MAVKGQDGVEKAQYSAGARVLHSVVVMLHCVAWCATLCYTVLVMLHCVAWCATQCGSDATLCYMVLVMLHCVVVMLHCATQW